MTRIAVLVLMLLAASTASGAAPVVSGRILFSADRAPVVSGEVYVLRADGRVVDVSRSPWNDQRPAISPDGRRVAFVSDRSGGPAVYTVDADGRHLRFVVRARSLDVDRPLYAWSPDGSTLAVATLGAGDPALAAGPLYVLANGRLRRLASLRGGDQLSWTPDGRLVTYLDGVELVARDAATGRVAWRAPVRTAITGWTPSGLYAGDSGAGTVLVYDARGRLVFRIRGDHGAWSPDGRYLVSTRGATIEIRGSDGRLRHRIALADVTQGAQPLWVGAHRLFVSGSRANHDIDAATGRVRADTGPWPIAAGIAAPTIAWPARRAPAFAVRVQRGAGPIRTFGAIPGCHDDGSYIPAVDGLAPAADGSAVAYASRCFEPFGNLYALVGTHLQRLTTAQSEQVEPSASPDGTRIAYSQAPAVGLSCKGCPFSIWVAAADGSRPTQLTSSTESFDGNPTWSPDGKTLLFARSDPTSYGHLYTVPASGGPITPLDVDGARPAWGPTAIAYVTDTAKGEALWIAEPDGSNPRRVALGVDVGAPAWAPDGRLVFLLGQRRVGIWDGSRVRALALPFASVTSVAWSPDGARLVVTARASGTPAADVYTVAADGTSPHRLTANLDARDVSVR